MGSADSWEAERQRGGWEAEREEVERGGWEAESLSVSQPVAGSGAGCTGEWSVTLFPAFSSL